MRDEVLELYRALAAGGVGLIVTGDVPALPPGAFEGISATRRAPSYDDVRIEGIETITGLRSEGFDGVQLHAAHGGFRPVAAIGHQARERNP